MVSRRVAANPYQPAVLQGPSAGARRCISTADQHLQGQIEKQAGALLDEHDWLIQERIWLSNEIDNAGDA